MVKNMLEGMIVLGENLNTSRLERVEGGRIVDLEGGRKGLPYDTPGGRRVLDLTRACRSESARVSGKVAFLAAAIEDRDEEFIAAIARHQVAAGADILDCCLEEIAGDPPARAEHMRWLVRVVQRAARGPVAIDSADPAVLRAGIEACDPAAGAPVINSVSLAEESRPLLELARERGAWVLANASAPGALPPDAAGRVRNLTELMARLDEFGIPMNRRILDPLLLPIVVNQESANIFLEACRGLRERFGGEFHLTGGMSNVSYGLPRRRWINEAMTWLAREAGCDVAFIDPLQVRRLNTGEAGFQKAKEALTGKDPYCMNYVTYCRGESK